VDGLHLEIRKHDVLLRHSLASYDNHSKSNHDDRQPDDQAPSVSTQSTQFFSPNVRPAWITHVYQIAYRLSPTPNE